MVKFFRKFFRKDIISVIHKKLKIIHKGIDVVFQKPLKIQSTDKILILSPHPDDESIGCGGLLLEYANQCRVVCLTDGCLGGDSNMPNNELVRIRKEEFINAMNFAKVEDYQFLNIHDGNLLNEFNRFTDIDFEYFDFIFIPNILDNHLDHKAVGVHFEKLLKLKKLKCKVCFYEVWNALGLPNVYLDISDISQNKKEMISLYQSQTKYIDYHNRMLSLNNYRGMSIGVKHAEVYCCVTVDEFLEMME